MVSSRILEVDCFAGDLEAGAKAVVERALARKGGYACLANVHVVVTAQHDAALRNALDSAWIVFPDGAPVAWLQRRGGVSLARRVGGPDLMAAVLEKGRSVGLRHFLFGSTPGVVSALETRLRRSVSGVEIVGTWAPDPHEESSPGALRRIRDAAPDVVWVALGAPKQELWMLQHAERIAPAIALGVGAAFDFHAGAKRRAPRWIQRAGLEWAHRFATEPRRLGPRYLRTNTEFLVRVVREGVTKSQRIERTSPVGDSE